MIEQMKQIGQSASRAPAVSEMRMSGEALSFKSSLLAAIEAQAAGSVDVEETLSLEAYKEKIRDEIARIIQGYSRCGRTQVYISEAGFARMWAEPNYEQKVMALLRRDIAPVFLPGGGAGYLTIQVGKDLDEYRASSFNKPDRSTSKRQVKSYWEKRAERRRERLEWEKERQEKLIAQKIFFKRLQNLRARRKDGEDMPIISTISAAELFFNL